MLALLSASCGRIAFDATTADGNGSNDSALVGGDGPLDCPTIGDVCNDGTIYVGTSPDGNLAMFTEATTGPDGPWSTNPTVQSVQTGLTSKVTGAANTAALALGGAFQDADAGTAGVQANEAAERCASLTANGHTDWYLPAYDELRVLATNQVAIGGFMTDEYWASSEDTACPMDCAKAIDFPSGAEISFRNKFDFRRERCVRKQ